MALRWGIVGTGSMAEKFVTALTSNLTTIEHKIVSVGSRSLESGRMFATKHNIANFYGSYEEMAKDQLFDVAYIATDNPERYDICLLMLRNGKHILCETPFCMNRWQTKKVFEFARLQNRLALGGIWSRFFPSYQYLKEMIAAKVLDDIREVYIKHGVKSDTIPGMVRKAEGGGVTLNMAAYAIQFALFCFDEYPKSVKATGKVNADGVDLHIEVDLIFSERRFARIICSAMEKFENQAVIISKKGTVCFPSYFCPLSLIEPDCTIRTWWIPETEGNSNSTDSFNFTGLKYEADEVSKCIRSNRIASNVLTPDEMISVVRIQDEIRKQIGVHYECDKR